MLSFVSSILKSSATRHYVRVMAFVVLLFFSMYLMYSYSHIVVYEQDESERTGDVSIIATSTFLRSAPIRLIIPKINVDTTFVSPLGLDADQRVSVPASYEEVGWYKNGPTPGEIGPAVILGHVDSHEGPAVFFSLGQLEAGDEVYVEREDGTKATFVVLSKVRVPQSEFPTEDVYGHVNFSGLRLVTCTGIYDHGELKYSHNLIVYAKLKE